MLTCGECGREFDLSNDIDMQEWAYGHDCEVVNENQNSNSQRPRVRANP